MFNESLKEIRTQSGISQKALAEKLFVSQQTVAKWETGKATPNPDMVVKLAEIFHVTTDELLGAEMNVIKKIRTENKLSQAKFAEMLNVHQTAVSQWENGRTTPDVAVAKLISQQFGVSLDELLGNEMPVATHSQQNNDSVLDDVEFTFYGEIKDFTEEEKQDLIDFVQFIKSKRKDN